MARVLVVDDVPDLREVLSVALFDAGFDVATVSSVSEAKDFLMLEGHTWVVLLDLHLGDVPGQALVGWLRSHPRHRANPVIVMTADSRVKAVPGTLALLHKPLDIAELSQVLEQHYARLAN